ncbi:MAG: 2-oxoacid:ferredoxin oxidoreductase subunit beta [Lentisphaerales bacterium]|nr:2-oxoacid:ferredoxin oxidoreductase subunit beta [Lentisphaerales bacterium]
MTEAPKREYKKSDFTSSRDVKWCPGCGDYAILAAVQKAMAELGRPKENQVVVSGIGCSSRFPAYMDTFGFHSLHGRAPTVATGVKVANPDLDLWIVTGDGDGFSIGGNHIMHAFRRNLDCVILLFNNRIYGLTKGQYSPTSETEKVTKSSPYGSVDAPVNPLQIALAANASFVARTYDINPKHMVETFKAAREHKGVSFVEIYQNCVIFNDGAFDDVIDRSVRADSTLELQAGEKMIFGKEKEKCIVFDGFEPTIKNVADVDKKNIAIHNPESINLAQLLAHFDKDLPTPMGILRKEDRPTYDDAANEQAKTVTKKKGAGCLNELFRGKGSWEVK